MMNVEVRWAEVEPDGQLCSNCGEVIYFKTVHTLKVYCGNKIIASSDVLICDSCFEIVNKKL